MCGRYSLSGTPEEVARAFEVRVRENFPARYNIAPTQAVGVVHLADGPAPDRPRQFSLMRWAFAPSWAAKTKDAAFNRKPLINARSETVAEKLTFRNAFRRRRCLLPASGFYEWKIIKGEKIPHYIHPAVPKTPGALFGFAGIWETAIDVDGGEMDTVAILTASAGVDIAPLHSREPVIIDPADYKKWLHTDEQNLEVLSGLLGPAGTGTWHAYPVDRAVGNARNEGKRLIEPAAGHQPNIL